MARVVETTLGPVLGFFDTHVLNDKSTATLPPSDQTPVTKYLGIPYGRITARWTQVFPADTWTETRLCHEYGPACPQPPGNLTPILARASGDGFHLRQHVGTSESNMFTANVYASHGVREGDDVPVMVWIYGGSWKDGAASSIMYDPTNLVRRSPRPIVVVTLNYRVNVFGFFASRDLVDANGLVGNYGVRDQLLGLKWVSANIRKFGGDQNNITLFGESAGAASVGWHIGGVDPLFRRAIAQSGAASTMAYQPLAQHEKNWHALLDHFKIARDDPDRVAKARAVPTRDMVRYVHANPSLQWAACVESGPNAIWQRHPDVRIARGEFVSSLESLMLGCTLDEGSIFADFFGMAKSQAVTDKFLSAFGNAAPALTQAYAGITGVETFTGDAVDHPASRFLHDALFEGPVRFLADTLSTTPHHKTGRKVDIYLYRSEAVLPKWHALGWGVHHFSEVPFVFDVDALWRDDPKNKAATEVARTFGDRWRAFAETGRPSSPTDWPAYDATDSGRKLLVLNDDGTTRLARVAEGRSEEGIALLAHVIRARWGIEAKKAEVASKI